MEWVLRNNEQIAFRTTCVTSIVARTIRSAAPHVALEHGLSYIMQRTRLLHVLGMVSFMLPFLA
jgi:hypothetical protein